MGGDDPDPPKEPPAKRARPDPGASEDTATDEVRTGPRASKISIVKHIWSLFGEFERKIHQAVVKFD